MIEASKIRQLRADKRYKLPNNSVSKKESSTVTGVEEADLPTTPSKIDWPAALLAFYNEDEYLKTPPGKRNWKCPVFFESVGAASTSAFVSASPVNQYINDDNDNNNDDINKLLKHIGKHVGKFWVIEVLFGTVMGVYNSPENGERLWEV